LGRKVIRTYERVHTSHNIVSWFWLYENLCLYFQVFPLGTTDTASPGSVRNRNGYCFSPRPSPASTQSSPGSLLALTHDGKFICFFNAHRVLDGVHFFFSVFLPLGRSPYLRRVLKFSSFISFPFLRLYLFRFSDDEYLVLFSTYNIKKCNTIRI